MKKQKVKYTHEPIGKVKIIHDFLPAPEDLVLQEDTVKVTLSLTRKSVDFFKSKAAKRHASYQRMMRVLIDQYVGHHT